MGRPQGYAPTIRRIGDFAVYSRGVPLRSPFGFPVLLPGGVVNADKLRMESAAQNFVRQIDARGKPIAVICHGPWLLVSSGLVKGKTMTSYYTLQDDIRNAGATWVDQEMVRDGNWV